MVTHAFTARMRLWGAFACAVALVAGCEQFDPIRGDTFCDREDGEAISMKCPQCQRPPYSENCSACRVMKAPIDSTKCASAATKPDSGSAGEGGESGSEGGSGEGGEGGQGGESGVGGAGGASGEGGEGGGGSGGMSPSQGGAGASGSGPMSNLCTDDSWCELFKPMLPGCKPDSGLCVQCTLDEHCGDRRCNVEDNLCEECVENSDCGEDGACDLAKFVCVDCTTNDECTTDPVNNQCNTGTYQCVDCVDNNGCLDNGVNGTCFTTGHVCVDCLVNSDCSEVGKPACDETARTCVECTDSLNCRDAVKGTCDRTAQKCVDCIDDGGCSGSTPVCDPPAQTCVECLDDGDCESNHCVNKKCVECEADTDCPSATAARCDPTSHECVGCTSNSQCAHVNGGALPACSSRVCVQCNDDTHCPNRRACIRAQHTCSTVQTNTLDPCVECQADSMCKTDMRCVPLEWMGETYGSYCAYIRSTRQGGSCMNARGFTQSYTSASTDNATPAPYCIPHTTTTCPGFLSIARGGSGSTCASGTSQCGIGEGDAICSPNDLCTIACDGEDRNCPSGLTCATGGFCGG